MSNPSKANEALLSGTTLQFKRFGGHSQEPPTIVILHLSVTYVKNHLKINKFRNTAKTTISENSKNIILAIGSANCLSCAIDFEYKKSLIVRYIFAPPTNIYRRQAG